ncbi:MAG: hypothetical protein WAN46_12695 [Gammaproteobacteria bacterium]
MSGEIDSFTLVGVLCKHWGGSVPTLGGAEQNQTWLWFAFRSGIRDETRLRALARDSLNALGERRLVNSRFLDMLWERHGSDHATYYGDMI